MSEAQFVFLWELMTMSLEKSLVADLEKGGARARAAYVAHLISSGRTGSARLVANGWSPALPSGESDPRNAYEVFHSE